MTRLARTFASGRKAFIPFIMAGDPDLAATGRFVGDLAAAGADAIELGVPFTDPIADGPVNQRAHERGLRSGTTIAKVLELVRSLRSGGLGLPLVLFTYLNPLLRHGFGLDGLDAVLAVDLPVEEALEGGVDRELAARGLDRIYLATPTTTEPRLRKLAQAGSGFLYYVAQLGVTGARDALPPGLADEVARARAIVGRPVAVGFGISTAAQAAAVGRMAGVDGVVVGSALVERIEKGGEDVAPFARKLAEAVHASR